MTKTYTLDCKYYTKKFNSIDELINNIKSSGMDPNYEILIDGVPCGEEAINFITF
tara:strand:+ start:6230 stop:6394 length:165 start_codon:yes stop_codon:yes gene_type:complete